MSTTEVDDALGRAAAVIAAAPEVALACHVNPDGDALGSMLALHLALRAAGRRSVASFPEPFVVADHYRDLAGLDTLAEFCDAGTRVIVIGRTNDVMLYRELVRRGVSDYLISPAATLDVVRSICGLFSAPDAKPVGRIIAVVGAKGGEIGRAHV